MATMPSMPKSSTATLKYFNALSKKVGAGESLRSGSKQVLNGDLGLMGSEKSGRGRGVGSSGS